MLKDFGYKIEILTNDEKNSNFVRSSIKDYRLDIPVVNARLSDDIG